MRSFTPLLLFISILANAQTMKPLRQFLEAPYQDYSLSYVEMELQEADQSQRSITAYYYKKGSQSETRPLLFIFNGGPGAASVFLHMGGLGPIYQNIRQPDAMNKVIKTRATINPDSLLLNADLVFIDPPGTGYSKLVEKSEKKESEKPHDFNDVQDAQDIYQFIDQFIASHSLFGQPVFLMGESYGGHRAAMLAQLFQDHYKPLAGLILIAPVISTPRIQNPNSAPLSLPSMSRILNFHRFTDHNISEQEVRRFAMKDFMAAQSTYPEIDHQELDQLLQKASTLTLIDRYTILEHQLDFTLNDFLSAVARDKKVNLSAYDGRYAFKASSQPPLYYQTSDPSSLLTIPMTEALMHWLSNAGLKAPHTYKTLNNMIGLRTDRAFYLPHSPNDIDHLKDNLDANPGSKVLLACGLYDLVIPCRYVERATHNLRKDFPKRVQYKEYEGGHMMYIDPNARKELLKDIRDILKTAEEP